MLITHDEVLLPNSELHEAAAFASALAARLASGGGSSTSGEAHDSGSEHEDD